MATILTAEEAAAVLRCETTDPKLPILLPQVDQYIAQGTGRDWSVDTPVDPNAKAAATMLLVRAFEDPGALTAPPTALMYGLDAVMLQLEYQAIKLAEDAST